MSRIVLAWELGGDYGHLYRFVVLARELRALGHEPVLLLRDLALTERVVDREIPCYQAPVWLGSVTGLPPPQTFAETLMRFGFLETTMLLGMLRSWRNVLMLLEADLVVCDYAPTAMLALRGLPVRRALMGTGFGMPPLEEPLPPYQWWAPPPPARIESSERKLLGMANRALDALGAPPLSRLADLLDADERFLCTFPELDHFGERDGEHYLGSIFEGGVGGAPAWPLGDGPRVFAYVKTSYPDIETLLASFGKVDARFLVHAPGISEHSVRTHQSARVAFAPDLVDMQAARTQCDAAVCHAGLGTTSAMLQAGKPLLLLPMHLEQSMTARRVEAIGAGLSIKPATASKRRPAYAKLIASLLEQPSYTARAHAFRERHADFDQGAAVRTIAGRCETLARAGATGGAATPSVAGDP